VWTGEIRAGKKYSGSGGKKNNVFVEGRALCSAECVAEEEEDEDRRFGAEWSVAPRHRQRTDHGYVKKNMMMGLASVSFIKM
jgi:hypothetical protein